LTLHPLSRASAASLRGPLMRPILTSVKIDIPCGCLPLLLSPHLGQATAFNH
jgi:hypothetical protein